MKNVITKEKIEKYLHLTDSALEKLKIVPASSSSLYKAADDFLVMARSYWEDAHYFYKNQDFVNAFAAINYAHGWLDAGVRLGVFEISTKHD